MIWVQWVQLQFQGSDEKAAVLYMDLKWHGPHSLHHACHHGRAFHSRNKHQQEVVMLCWTENIGRVCWINDPLFCINVLPKTWASYSRCGWEESVKWGHHIPRFGLLVSYYRNLMNVLLYYLPFINLWSPHFPDYSLKTLSIFFFFWKHKLLETVFWKTAWQLGKHHMHLST